MKKLLNIVALIALAAVSVSSAVAANPVKGHSKLIEKVLFIGDSMTGWMAERLNAYGEVNGFEVATITWDSSTIGKWGSTPNLASVIETQDPDVVFLSLGLNELFERNPSRLDGSVDHILKCIGDRDFLWIGPPSWPGDSRGDILNNWIETRVGSDHFFRSSSLKLSRQGAKNPHPTRGGIIDWIDAVVQWIPDNTDLNFKSLTPPADDRMSRGKVFIYKRAKENL